MGRLQHARRRAQCPRHIPQQADSDVHLQELVTGRHAFFQAPAHRRAVRFGRRIAITEDAIAELAARQLIGRHAVRLAGQIHQRHLDGRHSAGLTGMMPELLDFTKNFVYIARIFIQDATFEKERVAGAGAIAHLAVAGDTLVRIYANDRAAKRHADNVGNTQVGDA